MGVTTAEKEAVEMTAQKEAVEMTVQTGPMGRRPCVVRTRSGRVALPEVWDVH